MASNNEVDVVMGRLKQGFSRWMSPERAVWIGVGVEGCLDGVFLTTSLRGGRMYADYTQPLLESRRPRVNGVR